MNKTAAVNTNVSKIELFLFLIALLVLCLPALMTASEPEAMCAGVDPLYSPSAITTVGYPAMVTASECECTLTPGSAMRELIIRINFRREVDSTNCQNTHIFFTFHNSTYIVCPSDDPETDLVFDVLFHENDQRNLKFTLKNIKLDFLVAQVLFSTNPASDYVVSCINHGGSVWTSSFDPYLQDIDGGIKVAIVIIIILLLVIFGYVFKRIWEKRRLKEQLVRRKHRARQRKARQQRKKESRSSVNLDNSAYSIEPSGHTSEHLKCNSISSLAILNFSQDELSHNRSQTRIPDWTSTSGSQNFNAGCGSIWPMRDQRLQNQNNPKASAVDTSGGSSSFMPVSSNSDQNLVDPKKISFKRAGENSAKSKPEGSQSEGHSSASSTSRIHFVSDGAAPVGARSKNIADNHLPQNNELNIARSRPKGLPISGILRKKETSDGSSSVRVPSASSIPSEKSNSRSDPFSESHV